MNLRSGRIFATYYLLCFKKSNARSVDSKNTKAWASKTKNEVFKFAIVALYASDPGSFIAPGIREITSE